MKVRMLVEIAGSIDGNAWPPRGGEITVADHVANDLILNRYAEPVAATETAAVNPVTETAARPAARARKTSGA